MSHARLSASGGHRWIPCPGSVFLEEDCPNSSSDSAREGEVAHKLAEMVLRGAGRNCDDFIGQTITIEREDEEPYHHVVNWEMAAYTQDYVDKILEFANGNHLFIEVKVDYSESIGVEDQFGTSDAVIITADGEELQIHDLKYGANPRNQVEAFDNEQLMLYALGAIEQFSLTYSFKRARLVIHQPRLNHLSEWDIDIEALEVFRQSAAEAAKLTFLDAEAPLVPGEKQCKWCKAKAKCPALQSFVEDAWGATVENPKTVDVPFDSAALGKKAEAVPLISMWCKAIDAEVNERVLAGGYVPGFKAVKGRKGNREWSCEREAEKQLKAFRLKMDEMYELKLIGPASAEKLLKDKPRRWTKLLKIIRRPPEKLLVVPESDPRESAYVEPMMDELDEFEEFTPELEEA